MLEVAPSISPYRRFSQQRNTAKRRGVAWELTFEEWTAIWDASGQYANRGRKVGQYVMARNGDTGPYAVGNVSICQTTKNLQDSYINRPVAERDRASLGGWEIGRASCRERVL